MTLRFVAIAASEMLVRIEMIFARQMMSRARPKPALPTTYPNRKKRIMPSIVRMLGVNTPGKVPRVPLARLAPNLMHLAAGLIEMLMQITDVLVVYLNLKAIGNT